ncbi:MAG TPA: 3'-5' exonuclease, partial [Candidatus Limnocylindrales bacterium]
HGTKGLEFDHVVVLADGFPARRAVGEAIEPERVLEEERRLAYVGITRAKRRLFLSHAWRRATWGGGGPSVPSRFLFEIPQELMVGPALGQQQVDDDERPIDLDLVFGRRATRFGTPIRAGGGAYRQGSGRPGAPADGPFRPSRDLAARRLAFDAGERSGSLGRQPGGGELRPTGEMAPMPGPGPRAPAPRPIVPGERQFRDGDRVRHLRWGDGIVVTSKLTRNDEEVTVAFPDATVGRKILLASMANLERIG